MIKLDFSISDLIYVFYFTFKWTFVPIAIFMVFWIIKFTLLHYGFFPDCESIKYEIIFLVEIIVFMYLWNVCCFLMYSMTFHSNTALMFFLC